MIQEAIIRYLRKHRQESLSPKAVLFDMDGVYMTLCVFMHGHGMR